MRRDLGDAGDGDTGDGEGEDEEEARMAARGAAMVGGYALDHALMLRHLLVFVYGDIQRFFPAMDRDFVLMSELWYGLARDVREATLALYNDACMQYETDHGLVDFDFVGNFLDHLHLVVFWDLISVRNTLLY